MCCCVYLSTCAIACADPCELVLINRHPKTKHIRSQTHQHHRCICGTRRPTTYTASTSFESSHHHAQMKEEQKTGATVCLRFCGTPFIRANFAPSHTADKRFLSVCLCVCVAHRPQTGNVCGHRMNEEKGSSARPFKGILCTVYNSHRNRHKTHIAQCARAAQ